MSMKPATAPSALRVQEALGSGFQVLEFEASTKTAADAAAAVGTTVAQIAKSMIFRTVETDRSVLVVTSGSERVDEARVSAVLGEEIGRASAAFVRERTGFAIGGVSPVAHIVPPVVLIDQTLAQFDTIWAAAGTPNAVFQLTFSELLTLTSGKIADVIVTPDAA
jgi:prolyl-tRNA editing enzyme YbaK/EbsC (Cys-tRNA(Pro) deacylase)